MNVVDLGAGVWHLRVPQPSWATAIVCTCGAEFRSGCQFWKHQADAYIALSPIDGGGA